MSAPSVCLELARKGDVEGIPVAVGSGHFASSGASRTEGDDSALLGFAGLFGVHAEGRTGFGAGFSESQYRGVAVLFEPRDDAVLPNGQVDDFEATGDAIHDTLIEDEATAFTAIEQWPFGSEG